MTAKDMCILTGTKQVYSIICRKHATFKDIILRGEENILKRVTDNKDEAKWQFLAVVTNRFFVVYEDPRFSDSEITKGFMAEHECVVFYSSCSIENKQYHSDSNYPRVTTYNICYGSLMVFYLITRTHSSSDELKAFKEKINSVNKITLGEQNNPTIHCPVLDFYRTIRDNPRRSPND